MTMLLRTLVIASAVATFIDMAMAANYLVGAPNGGWDLNTPLQAWANAQKFVAGDTLTFVYGPTHNVLQVSKPDYDACLTNGSIASYSGGNNVVSLSSSGSRYYICGTSGHCDRGMKMVINILGVSAPPPANSSVPPAATPSSPAPATPAGSPTSSPTTSPVSPPPKTSAPTHSPKLSPSVSPSKSPVSSPSKSPVSSPSKSPVSSPSKSPVSSPSKSPAISPSSSTPAPAAESPASPTSPDASSPSTPPSSANKISVLTGSAMGMGFTIMMLLNI